MATDSCYYKMSLSNKDIEDNNDSQKSTVSDLTIVLEKELDLLDSIFMKAMATEISLEMITLSSLPCTFSASEQLRLTLRENPTTGNGNAIVTESEIKERNKIECKIQMDDTISDSAKESINYLNKLIETYTNKFLLFRFIERLCDNYIFKRDLLMKATNDITLSDETISLLVWYIETAVVTRLQLIATINVLVGENTPIERPERKEYPNLDIAGIEKIKQQSLVFCTNEERPRVEHKLIKLESFYGTDLSKVTGLLQDIDTDIKTYLENQKFLVYDGDSVSNESKEVLRVIKHNNITLLQLAELSHKLIKIEKNKRDSLGSESGLKSIYHNEIVALEIDATNKCIFTTKQQLFLPTDGSAFSLAFDPIAARTLGKSYNNGKLEIGPLQYDPKETKQNGDTRKILKLNNITSQNERLYSQIKPLPRTFHILTDVIENDCKVQSMWLRNTAYASYQVLASFEIDKNDVKTGSIQKICNKMSFVRMKQSQNILRNLRVILVGDDFNELCFMTKTYAYFSICFRPANLDL